MFSEAEMDEDMEIMCRTVERALHRLTNMTTEEFSKGGDREIREELANALGYASYEQWLENRA